MKSIVQLTLITTWVAGIVLAKGFWLTLFSICMPLYSWYLVVEKIMQMNGII